jgi:hypothetical protein
VRGVSSLEFVESKEKRHRQVQARSRQRNQIPKQLPRQIHLVWIFVALLCGRFFFFGVQGEFIFQNPNQVVECYKDLWPRLTCTLQDESEDQAVRKDHQDCSMLHVHQQCTSKGQATSCTYGLVHTEDYAKIDISRIDSLFDYFDYLSRLVSTRKLVEDGSRDINN